MDMQATVLLQPFNPPVQVTPGQYRVRIYDSNNVLKQELMAPVTQNLVAPVQFGPGNYRALTCRLDSAGQPIGTPVETLFARPADAVDIPASVTISFS